MQAGVCFLYLICNRHTLTVQSLELQGPPVSAMILALTDMMYAICDGLQSTPGAGAITIGSLVVAGTITAKGTALASYPKVCMATSQAAAVHMWRVVSLGTVGTGAVGTTIVIERV